jgi:V8-like Glu-specific endopeptidase
MNPILLATLFPVSALPQDVDGEVRATTVSEQIVEARRGEDGTLRYREHTDEDVSRYLPLEVPESGLEPRHDGPDEAITLDVVTGLEKIEALPYDPFHTEGWMAGRALADEVTESLDSNFGTFSKITSTAYPWSTQCRVFFDQPGGSYVCSGTMIDAKNLITAGHCVNEGSGGSWSTNVWVAPRWDGDAGAFGTANATLLGSFTGWTSSGSGNHDMGFIRLDRPVGFLTGWLGSFWNSSSSFWYGTTFNLAGFPAVVSSTFPDAPDTLYYAYGTWNVVNTYTVDAVYPTTVDFGGLSGTGVYYIDSNGNRYVGGDHRSSFSSGGTKYRRSCRMTQSKFDWFHDSFKPGGYFSSSVDYVPLKVRLAVNSIQKGSSAAMTYVVGNNSLFNPATATVDVDVYLSTNSDISTFDTKIQSHSFDWNFGPVTKVTVNVGSVTIPGNTPAGTKYLGVIVNENDASTSNNDTDGWDAHRIVVTN